MVFLLVIEWSSGMDSNVETAASSFVLVSLSLFVVFCLVVVTFLWTLHCFLLGSLFSLRSIVSFWSSFQ